MIYMGLFKRKKDEDVKIQLERESLDKINNHEDDGYTLPFEMVPDDSIWNISGKTKAPHTITAEELNGQAKNHKKTDDLGSDDTSVTEKIPMSSEENNTSPSEFLFKKMVESRNKNTDNSVSNEETITVKEETKTVREEKKIDLSETSKTVETEVIPTTAEPKVSVKSSGEEKNNTVKNETLDIEAEIKALRESARLSVLSLDNSKKENEKKPENKKMPDVVETLPKKEEKTEASGPVSSKKELFSSPAKEENIPTPASDNKKSVPSAEERRTTLLARCNAYLEDDEFGTAKIDTDKYKLESVESILEGFETRAAQRVSKKFSNSYTVQSAASQSAKTESKSSTSPTPSFDTTKNIPKKTENTEKTFTPKTNTGNNTLPFDIPKDEVKHLFTATVPKKTDNTFDSDFSTTRIISDISSHSSPSKTQNENNTNTKVMPTIKDNVQGINSESIISTKNEEETETPTEKIDDYKSISDRERIMSDLKNKKRTFLIKTVLNLFLLIPAALLLTPLSETLTAINPSTPYIIDLVIAALAVLFNLQILESVTIFFKGNSAVDMPAALSLIATLFYSIVNMFTKSSFIGVSAILLFTILSYSLSKYFFYSSAIKNFSIIATPEFKSTASIINNKNITKSIVNNTIEGSALICYGGETTNVHGFLSYTFCQNPVASKIKNISIFSLIFGAVVLLLSAVLTSGNMGTSLYYFLAVISLGAIPSVYHLISVPINAANKRLRIYDAMLTGYRAADELELCNGIAVSSEALFPEGSIRLVDMKLLSPNPFDQSMLDAAAIASAIHSPIAGIFKQVNLAKTYKTSEPEVDSVIYEEKMGISGWVNDRRVFVGNRDLMVAHGFAGLPPAELDKKIMRKGYFPVYIASDNIPCALLVVRYEPDGDIAYELQRLSNTGTTVLVHNCDPNINVKMLCDYFEVYDETIAITTKQGSDNYRSLVEHREHRRAGAAFKSTVAGLFATLTASINIKKYVSILLILYICSVVLGFLGLITCLFAGLYTFLSPLSIILFELIATFITVIVPIIRKP